MVNTWLTEKLHDKTVLLFCIGFVITLLYLTPVLIQWEDAPMLENDFLNIHPVWYKGLIEQNQMFGSYDELYEPMIWG